MLAVAVACRRLTSQPDGSEALCASACDALVEAANLTADERRPARAACFGHCQEEGRRYAPAGCERERRGYLDCAANAAPNERGCSPAVCLETGNVGVACRDEFAVYRRCVAPCDQHGVRRLGHDERAAVRYEVEGAGCAECVQGSSGAPAGAPCDVASVCAAHCCRCAEGAGSYRARVCENGECAAPRRACLVTAGVDLCGS